VKSAYEINGRLAPSLFAAASDFAAQLARIGPGTRCLDPSKLAGWDSSEELDRYVNDTSNNFIRVCNGDAIPDGVRIDEKDPDLKPLIRVFWCSL
jgi:hypothetical protein